MPTDRETAWLLAIDSSTEQAGVAVYDGVRRAEICWDAGREQTVTLLPQVHAALGLLALTVTDVAAIAVAVGPGTFNGLRVGMSLAKGLVLGLDVPLLGVSTLDATALPYAAIDRPVVAVVAAGRDRLVWAEYETGRGGWRVARPARNGTLSELAGRLAALPAGTTVTGELTPEQEATIAGMPGVLIPPRSLRVRRPGAVAELAWARLRAGERDDAVTLSPVYLHGVGAPASPAGG